MEILEDLQFIMMEGMTKEGTTTDTIMTMVLKIITFPLKRGASTTGVFMEELMETAEVIHKLITMITGDSVNSMGKDTKVTANITITVNCPQ